MAVGALSPKRFVNGYLIGILKAGSIFDLIHGDQKVEKKIRYPFVWGIVTVISLGAVVFSCISFYRELEHAILGEWGIGGLIEALLTFGTSLIIFHIGLARSAVYLLLCQKRLCSRGTSSFVLRQLSGVMGSNSVMIGMLAFLLTFVVIGSNFSFVKRASQESSLNHDCPYDIMYCDDNRNGSVLDFSDEIEEIIGKYAAIEAAFPYTIYTTGQRDFYRCTDWYGHGEGYEGLRDCFMSVSDFNFICVPLGYEPIELSDEFMIAANTNIEETAWSRWADMYFVWNGKSYH